MEGIKLIHVIIYSKDADDINAIRNQLDLCCRNIEYTFVSFKYPMDILDYLNTSRPERCAVFYVTETYAEGLEIAEKVNEVNPRYRFNLFCDSYDDAEQLFYNGVTYYIQTPYNDECLKRCSEFLSKYYEEKAMRCIQLKSKAGLENIILSDVDYVMSDKRKVLVKSRNYDRVFYYKLDDVENMLGEGFLRCHQSYVINMTRIKQFVEDGVLLDDDTFIPVSRKRYYASKREYLAYITGNHDV